jgi:hypothetical protein
VVVESEVDHGYVRGSQQSEHAHVVESLVAMKGLFTAAAEGVEGRAGGEAEDGAEEVHSERQAILDRQDAFGAELREGALEQCEGSEGGAAQHVCPNIARLVVQGPNAVVRRDRKQSGSWLSGAPKACNTYSFPENQSTNSSNQYPIACLKLKFVDLGYSLLTFEAMLCHLRMRQCYPGSSELCSYMLNHGDEKVIYLVV